MASLVEEPFDVEGSLSMQLTRGDRGERGEGSGGVWKVWCGEETDEGCELNLSQALSREPPGCLTLPLKPVISFMLAHTSLTLFCWILDSSFLLQSCSALLAPMKFMYILWNVY